VPRNSRSTVTFADGQSMPCIITDLSLSGAALNSAVKPPLGSLITLGHTQARVVRHRDDGYGVEFTRLQHPDFLDDILTG
jgi:hypothetical protein